MRLITAVTLGMAMIGLGVGELRAAPSAPDDTAANTPSMQSAALSASDARLVGDSRRTRLIFDLGGPTSGMNFRAFVLADPYRVVIDLPQIAFNLPKDAGKKGRGLVDAYRFGLMAQGKSRIVMDLTGPATIDKSFLIDAQDGQPARLVIDLLKADRASFMHKLSAQKAADMTIDPPDASPPDSLLQEDQPGPPVVVIDPGHGGIDSGAASPGGEQEKTIVLDFARKLANKINGIGRYHAILTRDDDTYITLQGRIAFARTNKASLFISVHADTLHDPFGVRGATIYTLSDRASDTESARYAEKENRSDAIAGVDLAAEPGDVADILIDLTRRETKSFSNRFAKVLIDEFQTAATLNKNPHRSAGFMVLTAPDIPSVLLELGYLSSRDDVKLLTSADWQDKAADAVVKAVDAFFVQRRQDTAAVPVPPQP